VDVKEELAWRRELSALVHCVFSFLSATHTGPGACGWLLRKMKEAWEGKGVDLVKVKTLDLTANCECICYTVSITYYVDKFCRNRWKSLTH